jgi:broad specificity phosphatase PhoE
MSTTRLLLVRHGATVLSAEDRFAGASDVALSETGQGQARALAERLRGEAIAAFYASPLSRTRDTARILAEPHGKPVELREALREISHGPWEGRTRAEVEANDPATYARWEEDPFSFAPEGGETGLAVTARALPSVLGIAEQHAGEEVVIVSHKATIRLVLCALLGFDPRAYRDRLDLGPAALSVLDVRDSLHARLALYNDTSHYAPGPAHLPGIPSGRLSRRWSAGESWGEM